MQHHDTNSPDTTQEAPVAEYNYFQKFVVTGDMAKLLLEAQEQARIEEAQRRERWLALAADHPKGDLLRELIEATTWTDYEGAHGTADRLLLQIIDDPLVSEIFEAVGRWYA